MTLAEQALLIIALMGIFLFGYWLGVATMKLRYPELRK